MRCLARSPWLSPLRLNCATKRRFTRRFISTNSSLFENHDIVIVGGGPAGLSLASSLLSNESVTSSYLKKITLVDGASFDKLRSFPGPDLSMEGSFSNRVSSVTADSRRFLEGFGGWDHVDSRRTWNLSDMVVSDGVTDALIEFPSGQEPMATLTENINLQKGLLNFLSARQKVGNISLELLDNTKVENITRDDNVGAWPIVTLSNGRVIRARLLVGADGANSPVKSFAGIKTQSHTYDAMGVVANLSVQPKTGDQNSTAYQRFLPTGPIAYLPLSPTHTSIVWSLPSSIAKSFVNLPPETVTELINSAFRLPYSPISQTLHSISSTDSVPTIPPFDPPPLPLPPLCLSLQPNTLASFPLRYSHAETYFSNRVALLGDAAHTIHPLAGQGLNMGLGDSHSLSRVISRGVQDAEDVGSLTLLKRYQVERMYKNESMLLTTDSMYNLYNSTWDPIVRLRSSGLEVLNELEFLKKALVGMAGGRPEEGEGSDGKTVKWQEVLASSAQGWFDFKDSFKGAMEMAKKGLGRT